MPLPLRTIIHQLFRLAYLVVMLGIALFIVPVVWLRELWMLHTVGRRLAVLVLVAGVTALTGCTAINSTQLQNAVQRTQDTTGRVADFTRSTPAAPYEPSELNAQEIIELHDLSVTANQVQLCVGAAKKIGVEPGLVVWVVNNEIELLDSGELERDVLTALAGEDSSVGIAQVRVSTAEEIEQEMSTTTGALFPEFSASDDARTERIRRLASDEWSVLYASAYLSMLEQRFVGDVPLDLARHYRGLSAAEHSAQEQQAFETLVQALR